MKTRFRDRYSQIDYLKACEVARRIVADPALVEHARKWVEGVMTADPHQHRYVLMWHQMLTRTPGEIATALLEDSERGRLLRETRPIFGRGFTSQEVRKLMDQAEL